MKPTLEGVKVSDELTVKGIGQDKCSTIIKSNLENSKYSALQEPIWDAAFGYVPATLL